MQTGECGGLWAFVDWGCEQNTMCIVDGRGKALVEMVTDNTPEGLSTLVARLSEACGGQRDRLQVGIEVPHGPVVDTLLEAGFALFTLNPKQIDRFRDRYSPAGAKDDRRDSFVGANALRTDPEAFHRIESNAPAVVELREWSRIDRDLGTDLVAQANRLRAQILRVAPHWLKLCPAANEPWFWSMLELAATPAAAVGLDKAQVNTVLRSHRIRRISAEQVLSVWQQACVGTPSGVLVAVSAHVCVLLASLRLLYRQRQQATVQLGRCLRACKAALPSTGDGANLVDIALSQPGIGIRVASCLIGEAGRDLRDRNLASFRAQTGISPVTKQSGKTRLVYMRRACHGSLRDACYHWARVAVISDPRSKAHYAALKRKGHSHARALRGIAERLAERLFVMIDRGTLYDPNHDRVPVGHKQA
jgi:hypothetical protein